MGKGQENFEVNNEGEILDFIGRNGDFKMILVKEREGKRRESGHGGARL